MTFTALSDIFSFGKYKGRTLEDVLKEDRAYINWCINNIKEFSISEGLIPEPKEKFKIIATAKISSLNIHSQKFDNLIEEIIDNKIGLELFEGLNKKHDDNEPEIQENDFNQVLLSMMEHNKWNRERSILLSLIDEKRNILFQQKNHMVTFVQNNSTILNDGSFLISERNDEGITEVKVKVKNSSDSSEDSNKNQFTVKISYNKFMDERYEFEL